MITYVYVHLYADMRWIDNYIYICTDIKEYSCLSRCIYLFMYVCIDLCMYICMCVYICVCIYLYMYVCMYRNGAGARKSGW